MKIKRYFSAALSAVMAISAVNLSPAAETDNQTEYIIAEETVSGSSVSLSASENEYTFGSGGVSFAPGTYEIGVSLKNAGNIENDSMAASCIVGGEMTVSEDGSARIKVELTSVSMGTITGRATDWLIYQGTAASGDTVAADETTDSDGNVTAIEFDLPDRSFDGVYVSLYVGVISMTTNAYLAFDYGSTEGGSSGEISAKTYTGTATVDVFGYEITITVTVEDGIITALTVDGEAGNETSQAKLEAAAEGLTEKLIGLSAEDAAVIYSVDSVSSATYSSEAIIEAVMSALSLAIPDDEEEEDSGSSETVSVSDGEYTADISILKSDSDETSSAGSYFTTTDVPITVSNGKAYVKLAYTNSMIGDISQAVDGENYTVLEVLTDDDGYNYVLVEIDSIDDIENVQLVVNTPVGTMTHIIRVAIDTDTLAEVKTVVADGDYTADISILKEDSDETSSAGSYFTTTDVPITVTDGKAYVKLAYTNSMIGDISQAVDGENYTVLEVLTDDEGYSYVLVELDSVYDIENVQLVVNTPVGTMTHIIRIAINTDTLAEVKTVVADGDYTADISILKSDSDDTSSAGSYFTTTDVPITVVDGKVYVKLAYTNSMIGDISQAVDGENYTVLEVSTDDEGYNYVLVELDSVDDIENVQLVVNTPVGTMTHIIRVAINTDTLTAAEAETFSFGSAEAKLEAGEYDVDVSLKNAGNISNDSMAASCIESAVLTVNSDGTAKLTVNLQAVTVGTISGWATEWKIYQGSSASGDTIDADITGTDEEGNVTQITFDIPDNSADGVYVNMFIGAINSAQNAYIAIDYSSLTEESTVKTYTGTAHIDQFGSYDVTVTVTVTDGYITSITVEGSNFSGTYAETNQAKLEAAAEGLSASITGLSATDADAINGVDAVSGATYSSNAIKSAILDALSLAVEEETINLPAEDLAEGEYTVEIAFYTDTVSHSLVENDTITAVINVDSEGNISLTTDVINGTEKEPLYVTEFNGYYENNDPSGSLITEGTAVTKSDIDYSDSYFGEDQQVVSQVTFPLTGDYAVYYYTNSTIYVPAMNNLTGELEGLYFENGYFDAVSIAKIYWDSLTAVSGSKTEVSDGNYTADISILKSDSDETSSAGSYFTTTDVPITVSDGKVYVKLAYTNSMIGDISQALDGENYTVLEVSTDDEGYNYVLVELDSVDDIENVQLVVNTPVGTMTHIIRVAIDTDTLAEVKTVVADGDYTADISILKSDSDETSSAGSYFTTTDVPITVTDGKAYVKLAYTNSMIGDISQAVDGENYTVLEVLTDDEGYSYVLVELDSVYDIENVQLVVNTPVGTMTHIVRVAIDTDTLAEVKTVVADGDYTADISILKEDSDETSSAGSYFTTTDVPITVVDGKVYVKLAYTNSMIGDISQALDGENYAVLEVSTDDEGYNYVLVELDSVDDIENVQLVVNTPVGTMTHIIRIAVDTDTLAAVEENDDSEAVVYSVPVVMMSEVNQGSYSMGNDAIDGNAIVTVKDGKSTVQLTVKAVYYAGLYGHLTKLWNYPAADSMNYDWWNDSNYEVSADIAEYFTDYGLNYTDGDETTYEFPRAFIMERDSEKEDVIYIRISSDAMEGFDQAARLEFDWENAVAVENTDTEIQVESPEITVSDSTPANNQAVTVTITAEEGAEIYYTTDGSVPSESSNVYSGEFTVTGASETVTIYAVAVKDGVSSAVSSADIRFTASSSSSSSSDNEIEDGKYWMDIYLWNANLDQASMGDSAFDNNRQALVTVTGGGTTAKVQIATNPVSVSGYTSALQGITSSEVSVSVENTDKFTTNTRYDGTEHTFTYITLFSFTTTDLESEYIPVEISVPYTPMDGITENDGGYIAARLKLSWSSMTEAESNATLTANSTVASGSSSSGGSSGSTTSVTSDETGIKIKADAYVFDDDVTFTTAALTSGDDYDTAESLIDGEFTLYSISAEDENGDEVSPDGTADVYIPIIEAYGENVVIYRVVSEDNAESYLTELEYEISDDGEYYVITVKEFGLFAVVPTEEAEETAEEFEISEEIAEAELLFDDIEGHWAEEYIIKAVEMGLFSGIDENSFGPDISATRAMFVTVLGRLKGIDTDKYYEVGFNDVNSDDYFYPYVGYAAANDIVKGMDENTFSPYSNITREQMAVIICKFAESEGITLKSIYSTNFTDSAEISSWAEESVNALAAAGIINGRTDGSFDPKGEAARAEIAVMLLRFTDEYM